MRNILLCNFFLFLLFIGRSHSQGLELEMSAFLKFDSYPSFSYAPNDVQTNTAKISGISPGINVNLRSGGKLIKVKYGIGYYRYKFNKIHQTNSLFGESDNRVIEGYVPTGVVVPAITYSTDRYYYSNVALLLALEKDVSLSQTFRFTYGIQATNYLKLSQVYNIDSHDKKFKVSKFQYFGLSGGLSAGIVRRFANLNVGFSMYLPILDMWGEDSRFPGERDGEMKSKWLRGISVGVVLSRELK